jgi:hypothetical protein
MLGRIAKVFLIGMAVCLLTAAIVAAQAPTTISYQGRLTDATGQPITTATSVVFAIYSTPTGGSALYSSTKSVTPDGNGIFTVELGPFASNVFDGSKRYLGIKVGSDGEMTPRQLLTAGPYSLSTGAIADNSVTSAKIAAGAVGNSDLATNAVTTDKIASGAVGNSDLASNAVNGAKVSDGSLTRADLADEPGIAFLESTPANTFRPFPAATTALDSVSITVPGAGYVYVWAHTDIAVDHITGTRDEIYLQVATRAASITYGDYGFTQISVPSELPTQAYRWYMFSCDAHRPFAVAGAGTYKYFVNGVVISGAGDNDSFFDLQITAMYFPTAYGTVNKAMAEPGGGSGQVPTGESSGAPTE